MKAILLCILLTLSSLLTAQTVDHPSFKARNGSIRNITRIERTPETTNVFIHVIFHPNWWIMQEGTCYLEDTATGTKYPLKKAEGIELNTKTFLPDSGEMDYVLYFAPLPKETKSIHFLTPNSSEANTYDISLVKRKTNKPSLLEKIKGNWYRADNSGRWEYSIYDSVVIAHNHIYTSKSICKKGRNIELNFKDEQENIQGTLTFTPQKNGNYTIAINHVNEYLYTKHKTLKKGCAIEKDFTQFFHKDTAYLQGYINNYDPRLGFDNGLIYIRNEITREDYPTVVNIHSNGTFDAKITLNHPIENQLVLKDAPIPFYIEPGQTLTIYVDWEDIMARSRTRDYYYPLKSISYMGTSAELSQMYEVLDRQISYPYANLSKAQKEFTPNQFKEQIQKTFLQWDQRGDSLAQIYNSNKAIHLLKNKIALMKGEILFEFLSNRMYYAQQDSTNQVLKVREDDSYYEFLKSMPVNDEATLADYRCGTFINRFEYMPPLMKATRSRGIQQPDSITMNYPTHSLLTFLKENGIELTAEQEKLRIKQEKLAGKTLKVPFKEVANDSKLLFPIYETKDKLVKEYQKKYFPQSSNQSKAENDPEINIRRDKTRFNDNQNVWIKGEPLVLQLTGQSNPFLWQTALVRYLSVELKAYKTREVAEMHVDSLCQHLTYPILVEESKRLLETIHPKNISESYQLPEGKATDIFRNIIKNHPGKVLFVDFWGTSCAPCRAGIEHTADLREKYRNHPDFQFIYITDERNSPATAYRAYVEKNLKGEANYRVSETEFNYLRQLFKFNGIPHYELVEKDGSISRKCPESHNLGLYLEKRYGK